MPNLSRSASVEASRIREIALLADRVPDTLRLFYGEDTRPTPDFILEAGREALAHHKTFYTPNAGYPALRKAIADQYSRLHALEIDPMDRVVVTASGSVALLIAIQATIDPGDEAIIVTPLWPNVREMVNLRGATPVEVPLELGPDHQFQLNFEAIQNAITPKTRLIALASPNNPTGWTASFDDWQKLSKICQQHDIWLLADTVYDRLVFGSNQTAAPCPLSIPELQDRLWLAQSFSKAYRMTGWRVGWLVTPPGLWSQAAKLQEFIVSHAAGFSQEAARIAIEQGEPFISNMIDDYQKNRDLAVDLLSSIKGVTLASPPGAFYCFPKLEGLKNSFEFCQKLVTDFKVGFAPGSAFGAGGEGHIRICFAVDQTTLESALNQFKKACKFQS